MFCEQLGYNSLFRWFMGMGMTEAPFDHSTFSKNREMDAHRRSELAAYFVGAAYNLVCG